MVDAAADSPQDPAPSAWTCPACHNVYPAEFTVCPRDATPRADQLAAAADALIGEVLGRTYRITGVLGEGGMARLYAAEHLRIDARYAVKVIHDDLARDAQLLARFEREARARSRTCKPCSTGAAGSRSTRPCRSRASCAARSPPPTPPP
jgi:hypothetical protein